jgi:hypothetical protein
MLNCEPYCPALQATQCYKCWGWGHTQRFCKKSALCPRCGTAAHGEGGRAGEAQCPTHGNEVPTQCTDCTGKHPGWVRCCPEAVKARGAAREAYHFRPRNFELASQQQQQQREQQQKIQHTFQGVSTLEEAGDGFQEVGRKRPRGRPPWNGRSPRRGCKGPEAGKADLRGEGWYGSDRGPRRRCEPGGYGGPGGYGYSEGYWRRRGDARGVTTPF